ncbi:restriction endonuclease subunit S [Paenibacillus sp. YPG26]|uniref:restriction endonuclease subunit S n=1 Tax=Paenibacillus sp. YPG26 TaxID=2878915 RepID=UPI00203F9DDB|nr:restriction endonuclease subunit S [Paenibacillus sp. YPG26]USB32488.1 restriction endonuclease subunit S [Paenibacillus sp. YPG26]
MSRNQAYLNMLDASAKIQWNVAMMLEAKAVEAEKVRNWTLNHLHGHSFDDHEKQLASPITIHEQIIEVLEGITKLQTGLSSNLKAVLASQEDSGDSGGMGGMLGGGGFDFGDMDK